MEMGIDQRLGYARRLAVSWCASLSDRIVIAKAGLKLVCLRYF